MHQDWVRIVYVALLELELRCFGDPLFLDLSLPFSADSVPVSSPFMYGEQY